MLACVCGGVIELFIGFLTFSFFGACWKCIRKFCRCKAKHQECHCHDEVEVNKTCIACDAPTDGDALCKEHAEWVDRCMKETEKIYDFENHRYRTKE